MDFPKPLGLSIQLMGSHPILSATIVGCVVGAAYWMSGYRPSLPLSRPKKANGQANPAEKQSLIDQGMTISTTASQMDRLTGPCTSEQLSAYADSISIQQDTFGREIANGKYLIGQMRFLDKQKESYEDFTH